MLLAGFIPRGRGRAPQIVQPREPEPDEVEPKLGRVLERFQAIGDDLPRLESGGALARHQVFGHLNGAQWLRFVGVHHHHHWKIIRDIVPKTQAAGL